MSGKRWIEVDIDKTRAYRHLGGMGPEATAFLFQALIKNTHAPRDQGPLRVIVDNNPKIPERIPPLLGYGEDPLRMMIETVRNFTRQPW